MEKIIDTDEGGRVQQPVRLADIRNLVAKDMRAYSKHYRRSFRSGVLIIDEVAAYLLRSRGKGMRPMLTLLCARACGAPEKLPEKTLTAAMVVEMLHTASLVHDDVVDNADERRGRKTLNVVYNNKVAVLFGDFMLSRSLAGMFAQRRMEVLDLFSNCAFRLAKGELVEAMRTRKLDLDKQTYFEMVSDKTASLISAACQMAPLSLDKSDDFREPLRRYGELLGVAFQIRDDLLDLGEGGPKVGKPLGLDLSQAKITLPLIHTLEQIPKAERKRVLNKLRKAKRLGKQGKVVDLKDVIELIRQKHGIEYSQSVALDYARKAGEALDALPRNEYVDALVQLARYVAERKR